MDGRLLHIHRDEKEGRSKQGPTNKQGKATQHTQAVTFPKKNELSRMGLEPIHINVYIHVHTSPVSSFQIGPYGLSFRELRRVRSDTHMSVLLMTCSRYILLYIHWGITLCTAHSPCPVGW